MALWDGRFEKGMDELVMEFNASIGFDQRMYNEDIDGSIAHVRMLAKCGIMSEEERDKIIAGLNTIREKIESGEITFTVEDEDIHMGIESRLIEEIGDTGKKLHTARSRNDQVQVDLRLYTRKEICAMIEELIGLEEVILRKAEQYKARSVPPADMPEPEIKAEKEQKPAESPADEGILSALFRDKDRTIILSLILLLIGEDGNYELLLALLYLLM